MTSRSLVSGNDDEVYDADCNEYEGEDGYKVVHALTPRTRVKRKK